MSVPRAAGAAVIMLFAFIAPLAAEPTAAPSRDRAAFIDAYIGNLVYMVYIDEKVKIPEGDEFLYRQAIAAANDFLSARKMGAVVFDQVEKLRRDHTALVEEVEGENMSLVQWLAQKLNADVYIVIDVMAPAEKRGRQYFAQAQLNVKVLESSTGELLGSQSYSQLDRSVGATAELARSNAVKNSVARIMNEVVAIARQTMRQAVDKGLRYDLVLLNTGDAGAVLGFSERLATADPAVNGVETVHRGDAETRFRVFYFGGPRDFERLVYASAETVSGLGGMKLVSQRGKSFTFTTGM